MPSSSSATSPGSKHSRSTRAKTGSGSAAAGAADPSAQSETPVNPLRWIGRKLAAYLSKPRDVAHGMTHHPEQLAATLRKGDVLLIEGTSRFSTAIRYITQSTWSHAALCIGDAPDAEGDPLAKCLIEADINAGVRVMPLAFYTNWHTRICRPVGLSETEIEALVKYAME